MNKIKRGLWIIGLMICVYIWIFSAFSIYKYLSEAKQRGQEFAELAEMVDDTQNTKLKDEKGTGGASYEKWHYVWGIDRVCR